MIKFKSSDDTKLFLLEVGKPELLSGVKGPDYVPDSSLIEGFIKSRRKIIPKLKSFRKSQNTKGQWRKSRYSLMKGIRGYHKSTEGKRFHRALGRFLSTRDVRNGGYKRESYEPVLVAEVSEILKGLSSLVTHFYIENEYYHSVDEQVDLDLLMDEVVPTIHRLEEAILESKDLAEEDLDLLIRLVIPKVLVEELQTFYNSKLEPAHFEGLLESEENIESSYLEILDSIKTSIKAAQTPNGHIHS